MPVTDLGVSPLGSSRDLGVDAARAAIAAALSPIVDDDRVPLQDGLGRVLASDIVSPIDVPPHDNSAMDGYALRGADIATDGPTVLRVAGTAMAGAPAVEVSAERSAVRIMTGAVMPRGFDTVVPQELCTVDGDTVFIAPGKVRLGDNRRLRGEDLAAGSAALRTGRRLTPADLGLIASLGIATIGVRRRLRVALFSTGDEIRNLGEALDAGAVYDSNRYSLMAALRRLDVEIVDLGVVRDDPQALEATLARAIEQADAIITTGGVSAGDADHTRDLLAKRGDVAFWKVAMRPGRPFAFGPLRRESGERPTWLFALPGNPVAALVTFHVFVRDALLALAGAAPRPLPVARMRCTTAIRKRPGRTEFQRAIVEPSADGEWQVRLTGSQGAGVLRSMSEANALLVLGQDRGSVQAGELVDVWLFDGLV